MTMPHTCAYILSTLALLTTIVSTAYLVIVAVSLTGNQPGLRSLSAVAAASTLLALGCITNLTYQYGSGRTRKGMILITRLSTVPSLAAAILTAATLSWAEALRDKLPSTILGGPTSRIVFSGFGIWGSSVFFQLGFYTSLFWALRNMTDLRHESDSCGSFESGQEIQQPHDRPRDGVPAMADVSVTRSSVSPDPKKTLRSSLISAVRPVTSRTKLVTRDSTSLDSDLRVRMPDHDGFDSWDTSSVGSQARQAVLVSSSLTDIGHFPASGELETIPGSRPGSSVSCNTPFPDFELPPSNVTEISGSPRSQSPSISEAHIHPLFRSDSCTPPPTATPGTVVTASPLGGHVIVGSIRTLKQMRSGSLPSSPGPLAQPGTFTNGTTMRRPASIEMPPPLPDFILPPSPRSMTMPSSAYAKRKAVLDSASRD